MQIAYKTATTTIEITKIAATIERATLYVVIVDSFAVPEFIMTKVRKRN